MKRRLSIACALLLMLSITASPCAAAMEPLTEPALRAFAQDKPLAGWAYGQEHGFTEVACQPSHFREQMQSAMTRTNAAERIEAMQAVFSAYGFAAQEGTALYPEGLTTAELQGYGNVPGPAGEARITLIKLYGGGVNLFFVFLRKGGDWYLTDCLRMDYWEADASYPYPELMLHWAGKPGAWLVTRAVGHGTGVYIDCRQWYNVFTGQFDLAYTLEGFDSALNGEDWYYAGWKTELGFTAEEVSDALRYITYEGMVKNPSSGEQPMGEEVYSMMTLHEYRYDAQTASYVPSQEERRSIINPGSVYASGYLRERQ